MLIALIGYLSCFEVSFENRHHGKGAGESLSLSFSFALIAESALYHLWWL